MNLGIRLFCECGFDVQLLPSEAEENVYARECGACNRIHAYRVTPIADEAVVGAADTEFDNNPPPAADQSPVTRTRRRT